MRNIVLMYVNIHSQVWQLCTIQPVTYEEQNFYEFRAFVKLKLFKHHQLVLSHSHSDVIIMLRFASECLKSSREQINMKTLY